ncbi:hypothetical protein PMSD_26825 [Paenibacillus macquariensis subsp. defensor]|nr:hypothetical protein PMSD_26825 [Paenibacillus macquariensis subsp. defensor]
MKFALGADFLFYRYKAVCCSSSNAAYSPFGVELLTGKYGVNRRPEQGRLVEEKRCTDRYADEMNFVVADRFNAYAGEHGVRRPFCMLQDGQTLHLRTDSPSVDGYTLKGSSTYFSWR